MQQKYFSCLGSLLESVYLLLPVCQAEEEIDPCTSSKLCAYSYVRTNNCSSYAAKQLVALLPWQKSVTVYHD